MGEHRNGMPGLQYREGPKFAERERDVPPNRAADTDDLRTARPGAAFSAGVFAQELG